MILVAYFTYFLYVLTILWMLFHGLMQLHLLWKARKNKKRQPLFSSDVLPYVTIQLPVYNEKYVVDECLNNIIQLHYPYDRLQIQVLDDSTDETSGYIDQALPRFRNIGIDIEVIRREVRKDYKAGALQNAMATCKGNLIAIFDADFRPAPSFLLEMIPYFEDANVGLVQAKWTHLNKDENFLTRIQSILLDTYFTVEQEGRYNAGYFMNFCGTAGIWRKECIINSGGWDGTVLSEDLDLSYRAQLNGWELIYAPEISVAAELPSVMEAFKVQQFRWTKGIAQTCRKTIQQIIRLDIPAGKKLHSIFHLLSSFIFPCLLLNAFLTVPILLTRNYYPEFIPLTNYTMISALNLMALTFLFYNGSSKTFKSRGAFFGNYGLFLLVYLGMSVQNAIAVLQGFYGKSSAFIRTPKFADQKIDFSYFSKLKSQTIAELLFFVYFLMGICLSVYLHDYFLLFFFIMMIVSLGLLLYMSVELAMKQHFRKLFIRFNNQE